MEVDGTVIPFYVKDAMVAINIRKPSDVELRTCQIIDITSDLPWHPEEHETKGLDEIQYNNMVHEIEQLEEAAPRRLQLKRT